LEGPSAKRKKADAVVAEKVEAVVVKSTDSEEESEHEIDGNAKDVESAFGTDEIKNPSTKGNTKGKIKVKDSHSKRPFNSRRKGRKSIARISSRLNGSKDDARVENVNENGSDS